MSYMRPNSSGTECIGFSKQDAFRLLPKVSGANVHWANANHTFLTHKNPQTDTFSCDISPAKLRSTAWVWNPQGISKLVNKVDCQVPHASLKAVVQALLAAKILRSGILNVPLPYGMCLKVSPEGRHIFEQLLRFHVHKKSFDGTAFASGFLENKARRSQYCNETSLWRNVLLVNQKNIWFL
jgi:hypothetical protein